MAQPICVLYIPYDLIFDAYEDANATWRYLDFTEQVEYLADIIDLTIREEMHTEATYLHNLHQTRIAVKELLDGPDVDIDRIIRSVRANKGKISNKIIEEFPQLADPTLATKIVLAIKTALHLES